MHKAEWLQKKRKSIIKCSRIFYTVTYVTGKVNTKPPIPLEDLTKVPGYGRIRDFVYKPYMAPQTKKCHAQTEMQR